MIKCFSEQIVSHIIIPHINTPAPFYTPRFHNAHPAAKYKTVNVNNKHFKIRRKQKAQLTYRFIKGKRYREVEGGTMR